MKRRLNAKDVESLENTSIGSVLGVIDTGVADKLLTGIVCAANTTPICDHGTACPVDSVCHETAECTIVVCTNSCHDTCCAYDSTNLFRPLGP